MGIKAFAPEKRKLTPKSNTNSSENKKRFSMPKKNRKLSAQKTIPIHQIWEDGIFEVKKGYFSKSILFADINFQTARQEDQEAIFMLYCNLLNFFDPSVEVEITINNKRKDKVKFQEDILIPLKNDHLDFFRKEFNGFLKKSGTEGRNDAEKQKYLTITLPASSFEDARSKFFRLENEINTSLKRLGSVGKILDTKERLSILHDFFRQGHEGQFVYKKEHKFTQTSYKDLISPDSFEFNVDHFRMGEKYARVLFLRELPTALKDHVVSDLIDLPYNMMLSISFKPVEQGKAIKLINNQILGIESDKIKCQKRSTKSGYFDAFIPMDLKYSSEEANYWSDLINNQNEKMFYVNVTIMHVADTLEELNEDSKEILAIGEKQIIQIGKLAFQQEEAMAACLPIGYNKLEIDRTLNTSSLANLIPFNSQELVSKNGTFYGINAITRNIVQFNRKLLDNASGFIFGTPGSGKSFAAKEELVDVLLRTDDDIIYIDPERECTTLAKELGGEIVHISAKSKNYINPMDINISYADDDDPISLKSEFIMSICDIIIGGREGLGPREKSIIDRSLRKVYAKYLNSLDIKDMPTLKDFWHILKEDESKEAKDIALGLELYVTGSLSVFSNQTNIDVNNRFIVFDTKDLGKQLKTMGLLIVLDQVWNRITQNRAVGKRTWIYIDEIYLLFNNEYSSNFLFELYKRSRKWGGIPTGITQNVEDLLRSDQARSMLSNSQFILMMNQAHSDRKELSKLLNISDTQLGYVTNTNSGQGLMCCGGTIVPFVNSFPTDTKLYYMMTTKVDEIDRSIS